MADPHPYDIVTAHHEAGHAVMAVVTGTPFSYVTMRPRHKGTAAHVYGLRPNTIAQDIIVTLGGIHAGMYVAQKIGGSHWAEHQWIGCGSDRDRLDELLPFRDYPEIDGSDAELLSTLDRRVWNLLKRHERGLMLVAELLQEKGTLHESLVRATVWSARGEVAA